MDQPQRSDELAALRQRVAELEAREATLLDAVLALPQSQEQWKTYQEQRVLAEALRDSAAALNSTLDFEQVLDRILTIIERVVPHDACSILLLDPRSGIARVARSRGYAERDATEPLSTLRFSVIDVPNLRRMAETGQPMAIPDTHADPQWLNLPVTRWIRSYAAAPIRIKGQVIGFLNLDSATPNFYSQAHAERLRAFADQAAIAIENASLFAEAQSRTERVQVLNQIGQALASILGLPELYQLIYRQARKVLPMDAFYIALYDQAHGLVQFPLVYDDGEPVTDENVPMGQGPTSHVIRTKISLLVDHSNPAIQHSGRPFGNMQRLSASAMHVPMLAGDRIIGIVSAQSYQENAYAPEDLQVLEVIASQAAIAIENARLYQAAQDERTYLQALIESSRDGIVLISIDRRILVVNAPAIRLLRLPGQPEDWRGCPLRDALVKLHDTSPAAVRVVLQELHRIKRGDEPPGEGEIQVPPHTFHWLNLPVHIAETPLGRLIVYRDVTDERAVEQMREDMTHMMVHDLRNPLGAARTALELLATEPSQCFSPDQQQELGIARNQVIKMQKLVNRILDVNQLENRQMPLCCATTRLNELIAEAIHIQTPLAAAKGQRLESDVPPDLPPAWADMELIGQVLQNLVDNAIKFAPPGGAIRVTTRQWTDRDRPTLLVSISDTGPGIPDEIKNRLFGRFVRGRQKGHGSGLGLAFCKLAIEAHGERIWAESAPGQGATFKFTLALAESPTQVS